MTTLKKLVSEIEVHTGETFDLKNKRHFFLLNEKINRLHKDDLRRLRLIGKALHSDEGENEIYNDKTHYLGSRVRN